MPCNRIYCIVAQKLIACRIWLGSDLHRNACRWGEPRETTVHDEVKLPKPKLRDL